MNVKDYSCVLCNERFLSEDLDNAGGLNSKAHVLFTTDVIKPMLELYDDDDMVVLCNSCYEDVVEEVCTE